MKNQTFHWEIKTILAQFEQAFNDIVINRYNIDKESKDKIHVDFKYSPKSRTLHDLVQKNQHFKLPVVSISNGGIKRASERVFSKIDGSYWTDTRSPTVSAWIHLLQPVPVDITVNMSIIARFQEDIDQILTNFIPYCDPYIVVSWKWPDIIPFSDFEIRSHIKWGETISFQYPLDINNTAPYRVIADTSFIIESWMFKNSPLPGKPIYVIDTSFTAVSAIDSYEVMKKQKDIYNTDYYSDYTVISARPQFRNCDPAILIKDVQGSVICYGDMFDYMDTVYVSSANWSMFDTTSSSPLSAGLTYIPTLTTKTTTYLGFSGIEVSNSTLNIYSKNMFKLTLTMQDTGYFDIIGINSAGYGYLTIDSIRPITNPYPIYSPEYAVYNEWQYPSISGVRVL